MHTKVDFMDTVMAWK